jgi:hypothetical protein
MTLSAELLVADHGGKPPTTSTVALLALGHALVLTVQRISWPIYTQRRGERSMSIDNARSDTVVNVADLRNRE